MLARRTDMAKITKDTGIIDAVQEHPEIIEVFQEYGLGCIGCMAANFETIGEGAGAHGLDVDALIEDINKKISE
jgi:hydrid cluster protein-associated redox disulfide domain